MFYRKKFLKFILILVTVAIVTLTIPSTAASANENYMYLGGFPAGFMLNTKTVEVIGMCDVVTESGVRSPAREAGIKTGDIIDKINGEDVNSSGDINNILSKEYKKYEIDITRGGDEIKLQVDPAKDMSTGGKKLGVLVKDSINGIGTVTYVDAANRKFASLGHPVSDANNNVIDINGGTVFSSLIYDVKKGVRGTPGELRGAFENGVVIGKAKVNCRCGVFGDLADNFDCSGLIKITTADVDKVRIGDAYIYTTIYGKSADKYKISIIKVDKSDKDNRNFVIRIDDDRLLKTTGGIVQGMSGSPIVQDGKLVGAVTHVFINDPTRGYGIAISNMTSSY